MPKVSVIIPTYNRAAYIAESIQSVFEQTLTNFEIVIIDDGSTDNTKEIIDSFKDQRIKYFHQENKGLVAAANRAMKLSRGEYISFFSSDDCLLKNTLEKSVEILDKHPKVAFSHGQNYLMDENGHVYGLEKNINRRSSIMPGIEIIKAYLLHGNPISATTVLGRRRCVLDVGLFDQVFSYGSEDCDLWIRLAKKYDVAFIAEPLTIERRHPSSMSSTRKPEEIEKTHSIILERIFNDDDLAPVLLPQRPKAYFHLYLRLSDYAHSLNDFPSAKMYILKALKTYPSGLIRCGPEFIYNLIRFLIPLSVLHSTNKIKHYIQVIIQHKTFHKSTNK